MLESHSTQITADTPPPWQRALGEAIRDPGVLIDTLGLDPGLTPAARRAAGLFPLRVPRGYVARMRYGDPADPLLRQVLPLDAETATPPGYGSDPVGDRDSLHEGGVIHKYRGRALLIATGACAIHCRYCFRRHFPYREANASAGEWRAALAYLAAATDVSEVLLSGGDPLSLSDRRLAELMQGLARVPHLRRLRVHSRLPVVLPERVDASLLGWLTATRLRPVMVVHANHPAELNGPVADAIARLRARGVSVYNQAVLLRGVNDDADTLITLSERLFDIDVQPYYLHLLDPVAGAAHFDVDVSRARHIMRAVASRLPGYLVPRLVKEIPGEAAKTWVSWDRSPLAD